MNILRFFRPGEQAPSVAELDNSADAPPSKIYGTTVIVANPEDVGVGDLGTLIGEVQATPTANTVLARLKNLLTGIILAAGENFIGSTGGVTPRISGTIARPADNTAYAQGDILANSGTAASVVPITFSNAARKAGGSGWISGCRATVKAASGTIVVANLAFDLLIFRPVTNVPFAAAGYPADNAALNVSAAAMDELIAIYSFSASAWRNQAGLFTAVGDHVYQAVGSTSNGRTHAPFNLADLNATDLLGLIQMQAAWTPTGIVNTFKFVLDIDGD